MTPSGKGSNEHVVGLEYVTILVRYTSELDSNTEIYPD